VEKLYHNLKEKYKQEALDVNVFWGCPMYADDGIKRNNKEAQNVNIDGHDYQLLTNRIKYAPYINAVTSALETC